MYCMMNEGTKPGSQPASGAYLNIVSGISVNTNFLPLNRPWIVYGLPPESAIPDDLVVVQDTPPLFASENKSNFQNYHRIITPIETTTFDAFHGEIMKPEKPFNTINLSKEEPGAWQKVYRVPNVGSLELADEIPLNSDYLPIIKMNDSGVNTMIELYNVNKELAMKIWEKNRALQETIEDVNMQIMKN